MNDNASIVSSPQNSLFEGVGGGGGTDSSFRTLDTATLTASGTVSRKRSNVALLLEIIKYTYSTALLLFCAVVLTGACLTGGTVATVHYGIPGWATCLVVWVLVFWLALMEGGQTCLVGLEAVDENDYARSHPVAHRSTRLTNAGDNLERFIVGNQFLIFAAVFGVHFFSAAAPDVALWGLPSSVTEAFLAGGIAAILLTVTVGQLVAQVNSEKCMLDFINCWAMVLSARISLCLQSSGIMHSVYVVQMVFSKFARRPIVSNEIEKSLGQRLLFWSRAVFSVLILAASLAVVIQSLLNRWTNVWGANDLPAYVPIVAFFGLIWFVGLLEGLQIALFSAAELPKSELRNYSIARLNIKLAFRGSNLRSFLFGRQILVTVCVFLVARITSIDVAHPDLVAGGTLFGLPAWCQSFINLGFLGTVATAILGSLSWRVLASSFPLAYLSNPFINVLVRLCILLDASGACDAAWVVARAHKVAACMQPDAVYLEGAEREGRSAVSRRDKDVRITFIVLRVVYSGALLCFCTALLMKAVADGSTSGAMEYGLRPLYGALVFWGLVVWLGMMEGGQGCLVGLYPVNRDYYVESHPVTAKCTGLAHDGDNLERFIVGRQFLVVLVIFVLNVLTTVDGSVVYWNLPLWVSSVAFGSGLALTLVTVVVGQLTSQINAANCMLDFVDTRFMLFTSYVSLAVEASGILHAVYLVQIFFAFVTGQSIATKELERTLLQKFLFWLRVAISLAILSASLAVVIIGLLRGWTTSYPGAPPYISLLIFFALTAAVGVLEGMQIALFAVVNVPEEELSRHRVARAACRLAFRGSNLQAFLIGRQILVTAALFVLARLTAFDPAHPDLAGGATLLDLPDYVQKFLNLGITGAVVTTIVGSLAWRIVASTFPLSFLSNPLIYLVIQLCLLIETVGICSAAWFLAIVQKAAGAYQRDQVYFASWEANYDEEGGDTSGGSQSSSNIEDTFVSCFSSNEVEVAFSSLGTREFSRTQGGNSDSFSLVAPPRAALSVT
mmetsp:Transcript_12516/g.24937  ORF Transcript_12516/g.24937 Transcript_12516/m.24937 type:complete len:1012 (+) Transcript_12516:303-3338(+)